MNNIVSITRALDFAVCKHYRAVARDAPNLLWLLTLAIDHGVKLGDGEVVAELKKAVLGNGLPKRCWRLIANATRRDFDAVLSMEGQDRWSAILFWLELHAKLDLNEPLPEAFQIALLREAFAPYRTGSIIPKSFKVWRIQLPLLRTAAREAVQRYRAGSLQHFIDEEFTLVYRCQVREFELEIDRNKIRWSWRSLLKWARAWCEETRIRKQACRKRWDSVLTGKRYGDYEVVPITDSFTLWLEGIEMRHCAGSYVARCLEKETRVFSVRRPDNGQRVATLAIAQAANNWKVSCMKGFANSPVSAHLLQLGKRIARDYSNAQDLFPADPSAITNLIKEQ